MLEPLKVNFPVVIEPRSKKRIIVLWARPVRSAHEAAPWKYVDIIGMREDGRHYKVRLLKVEYERARLAPVHFVEANIGNAPMGEIVDPNGKAFNA